jgi:hypothetical protein
MTSKKFLDGFSEVLMQDERILSPQERQLLTSLLHNARDAASNNPEIRSAVSTVIARAVGETVAQRAFTLLGGSIVDQILGSGGLSNATEDAARKSMAGGPHPGPGPQPPSGPGDDDPDSEPSGPQPPSGPKGIRVETIPRESVRQKPGENGGSVAVMEAPPIVTAKSVVLDEFLAPAEMEAILNYAMEHEGEFRASEVVSPSGQPGIIDYSHRRSRVLTDLGPYEEIILNRVRTVLPRILDELEMGEFSISRTEIQITASNDGDFFRAHSDNGQDKISSRQLTFVYFFHHEPNQFEGGELRLYDSHSIHGGGSYETIVPRQNQIVFFPCSTLHEITQVRCQSRAFADSRFTANGWLHK